MRPKMFILILVISFVSLLMIGCNGSVTPQRYVHKALAIMDKTALFAEGPLWDEAKKRALSSAPEMMDEAYEIVREALETAGGKHSFLMESSIVQYNDTIQWKMPAIEMTDDSILVITVLEFSGNETQAKQYAQTLQDGISSDARNVILDLRGNTGGNMYPMIAGVNALLPEGIILKFKKRNGRESNLTADYVAKEQGVERKATISPQIAILTDGDTASSGEALLICFRGLSNVRTFGSPTAGYASANRTFDMGDGSKLVITSSCDVARTGEVFCDDPIVPDILTNEPMDAALEWLRISHK
ncbi:MAG: S41 family peptidase [Bacteroidales bacterium]|nr:S41 family peptidase [Bacteroidales bacterium]